MSWFVDASVVVAITGREPDWEAYATRLDEEAIRFWSPLSRWESIVGSRSRLQTDLVAATRVVDEVASLNGFDMIPIGEHEGKIAIDAWRRYGKGSGHRAQLNMGDCFAYACAVTNRARLLFKGDDFLHTDLAEGRA